MRPTDLIHESWNPIRWILNQEDMLRLNTEVLPTSIFYPPKEQIFRVFQQPLSKIKVVILGQDPYPTPGNANGLAFAVNQDIPEPFSLKVIQSEVINSQYGKQEMTFGSSWKTLEHWEQQGVFLLNTALTVESGSPGSHLKYWQEFTKKVIYFIAQNNPCIWLLWGKKAQSYTMDMPRKKIFYVRGYSKETIQNIPANPYTNYILNAAHPAAEAYSKDAGFLGCNHFYFVNKILERNSLQTINW
jgi:uracil-DNA glycosylase